MEAWEGFTVLSKGKMDISFDIYHNRTSEKPVFKITKKF